MPRRFGGSLGFYFAGLIESTRMLWVLASSVPVIVAF
jgi:hypothetical protein